MSANHPRYPEYHSRRNEPHLQHQHQVDYGHNHNNHNNNDNDDQESDEFEGHLNDLDNTTSSSGSNNDNGERKEGEEAKDAFPTTFDTPFPTSPAVTVRASGKKNQNRLVVMPQSQSLQQVAAVMQHLEQDPQRAAEPSAAPPSPRRPAAAAEAVPAPAPAPRAGPAPATPPPPPPAPPRRRSSLLSLTRRSSKNNNNSSNSNSNWFSVYWAQSSLGNTNNNNTSTNHSRGVLDISEGPSAYDLYGRADRPPATAAGEEDEASSKYTIQSNLDYRGLRRKRRRNIICTVLFVLLVLLSMIIVIAVFFSSTDNGDSNKDNNNNSNNDKEEEEQQNGRDEAFVPNEPPVSEDMTTTTQSPFFSAATLPPSVNNDKNSDKDPGIPPSSFECLLCHDSSILPDPFRLVFPHADPPSNTTCADLQAYLRYELSSRPRRQEECIEWQIVATLRCGCTFPHPRARCTICPDQTLPDKHVLQSLTDIQSRSSTNQDNVTCEDLIYDAAVSTRHSLQDCTTTLLPRWAPWCQCPGFPPPPALPPPRPPPSLSPPPIANPHLFEPSPPAPPPPMPSMSRSLSCPVCFNGQPVPFPDARLFPELGNASETTCRTLEREMDRLLQDAAADTDGDTELECHKWQVRAGLRCGCPFPHENAYCHVCPDGSIPPPHILNRPTPLQFPTRQTPVRCVDLVWSAAVLQGNQGDACLENIQPHWGPLCSCPGLAPNATSDNDSNDDDDDDESSSLKMLEPPAMAPTPPSAPAAKDNNDNVFDCPLCLNDDNDDSSFQGDNIAVLSATGQNITCRELQQKLPLWLSLDEDPLELCTRLQMTAVLNCQCPPSASLVDTTSFCWLCQDGSKPTGLHKRVVVENDGGGGAQERTCAEVVQQVATISIASKQGRLSCYEARQEYATLCGCPQHSSTNRTSGVANR